MYKTGQTTANLKRVKFNAWRGHFFYENGEFCFYTVDRKIYSVIVSLPDHIPFVDLKNSGHIKKISKQFEQD
jgi:hypothetical protein